MPDIISNHLRTLIFAAVTALMPVSLAAELSIARGSASTASSSQGSAPEWVYALRPGDSIASVVQTLLSENASRQRLLEHNGLASNTELSVGDTLRIPVNWLKRQPEPARVISVTGHVQHISGIDGRKLPLAKDSVVRVGDEILSGAGSATVGLADGSELRISPNSRLMFNRLTQYGKSGMVDTRLRLQRGEVHTRVQPIIEGGARFEIETPSAVAAVRGTVFTLRASATGSRVQVTEGVVDFGKPGMTRRIPAGYGASVSTVDSGSLEIRQLPPAPTITPLPPVLNRLPAELTWQANGFPTYRLDIFDQRSGTWVQSREVTDTHFDIAQLDNGSYEIHLAALDRQGIAGMPEIAELEVDLQARSPDLTAPADGESVNDDMPEFLWQLNGTNEVARVEISEDESFRRLVTTSEWAPENRALPSRPLSPGQYYWRVVTEAGGSSVATSSPRKLIVNGTLPPVRIISVNYLDNQVRVFWESVEQAVDYRLQLSEEPGFRNIIKEADISDTTAALRLIPGRRYFVRVKALSEGPLASRWGPGRELYLD
ncbi:FecR domain-containing protein [Marinobacter daepoensis]|uniref:FecR domain-containing protein n=1 Tax=Marinobacter daepoensis TaxID=262077 RepID=A0ABS3BH61_9GAMM|nr:FecR domain-containing protein [Marinobacter daepoensis]MBN7770067.1 FecR domain-containing protein [Marinobacter daepoensis]MBY6034792.1 FecR domain-containing protein [Marinobacter daepoensis]MBY6080781.1 FecR domain-containing protein [Marinobacter daepoensis]